MTLYKILNEWGYEGLMEHTQKVADFYQRRRDILLAAMDKHLTGNIDIIMYWISDLFKLGTWLTLY